jgi:beta-lactamase regulating signal transducer with metallopeptidase domain
VSAFTAFPDAAGELALLLRATLLMGAAWAAAAALRKAGASAAARHLAWFLGIAGLLALPILWVLVPALSLPILPVEATPDAVAPLSVTAAPLTAETSIHSGWGLALLTIYAAGAATLLLRLVAGRRTLRRLWRDSGEARDPAWEKLLSELCARSRLPRRVELRVSRGPAVPMTWGTLAPKVLLPADASEWPEERRRLVLLHELAHIARFDSFSRSLASLVCAIYWFHPGAWFAARRMRMEQEHAADDHVLVAGGSAQAYALSLLHLARDGGSGPRFDQAAAMAGMYQLERRLVSIINPAHRNRPGTLFLSSSALLAGCTTLLVAAGVPVSASPTPLGPFREEAAEPATSLATSPESGPAGEPSTGTGPSGGAFQASPGPENATQRRARQNASASEPRSLVPASEDGDDNELDAPRGGTRPSQSEPPSPGDAGGLNPRQASAGAQQLRNYDWELPRRGSQVQTGSRAEASPPARMTLPTPLYPASGERNGPPKWARNVPRLVRGRPPTGSAPSAQGPVVLSWSLGGK